MGISPSRLSRRTLDLIDKELATRNPFAAKIVQSCVTILVRATARPADVALACAVLSRKTSSVLQALRRCIIVPCICLRIVGGNPTSGSRNSRYTLFLEAETPLRRCLGVPLPVLGIQGMYAGFRIFSCQGTRERFSLIHWTFFEIF